MPRITITVPDRNPQPYRFDLGCQLVTVGRGEDNDIVIDCSSVSVRHAEMRRVKGGYELRDTGSTNGIMLNEAHHHVIPLLNGLNVKVGDAAFDFLLTEAECDALAGEQTRPLTTPLLKPAAFPPRELSATPYVIPKPVSSSGGGFITGLVTIMLVALAFCIGLYLRHQKDTNRSLIEAIQNKSSRVSPAAAE